MTPGLTFAPEDPKKTRGPLSAARRARRAGAQREPPQRPAALAEPARGGPSILAPPPHHRHRHIQPWQHHRSEPPDPIRSSS